MLHITHKNEKTHHKALIAEVSMSLMLFSVFFTTTVQASDITADSVVKLVNKARSSADVAQLKVNDLLQKAAEKKAQDMIDNDYFAHVSPQGKTPWDFIDKAGYNYLYAGENLAINYTDAEQQQQAWMDSPLHRKNILNPQYQEIGVAVKNGKINGQMTTITVQEFGAKMPKIIANPVAAVSPTEKEPAKPVVAGSQTVASQKIDPLPTLKLPATFDWKTFFKNNPVTMIGWLSAFGIAILIVIVDVAALIHKKHEQLFILHDARRRQS
jgi:uncharacterized protein YkwD